MNIDVSSLSWMQFHLKQQTIAIGIAFQKYSDIWSGSKQEKKKNKIRHAFIVAVQNKTWR